MFRKSEEELKGKDGREKDKLIKNLIRHAKWYTSTFVPDVVNLYKTQYLRQDVVGIDRAMRYWRINMGIDPLPEGWTARNRADG